MPRSSRQKCRWSITSAIVSLSVVLSVAVAAQNQLYVYPLKKQSSEQQDRDRYECHRWAVQQTGFDPSKAYPSNPNSLDPQPYRPSQPHILKGAGRGAALGAVGGAIKGEGAEGGGFRRKDERRQQAAQQQANASSAAASQHTNYTRAMAACLEGRGYSVK